MKRLIWIIPALLAVACQGKKEPTTTAVPEESTAQSPNEIIIEAESLKNPGENTIVHEDHVEVTAESALEYEVNITQAGRYNVAVIASSESESTLWLEDYINNPDDRTYNITGDLVVSSAEFETYAVDGSPLNSVTHPIKLHVSTGGTKIDKIVLTLMKKHVKSPEILKANLEGENWKVIWSDEFDGTSLDTTKWTYDIGNWGWGNNELQYYTENREENVRLEDGNLIIEARKNDMGEKWTSARLTTRGKIGFLYGRIEFKAQVPAGKGNWAAAWTLGSSYVDEKSWPYCGEIDIMESVGYEVDDETLDGIAHCTVHTPAYYFKINNQISSTKDIENIAGEYHTYAVEWTPSEMRGFVDGEEYYVYDKTANEREWPFNEPQDIIINLAMGGGWGGAQGMDPTLTSQKILFDYVRVYGKE